MFRSLRRRRVATAIAALTVLAAAAVGCGGGDSATLGKKVDPSTTVPTPTTTTVPSWQTYSARANGATLQVFAQPNDAQPTMEMPNPWLVDPSVPEAKVPQVFLVKQLQGSWIQVLLPVRPNGSTGWVRSTDVTLSPNPFHVRVSLGEHTIKVTNADNVIYEGTVAVGKPSTPTPLGEYYLRVLIRAPDPNTVYGPYAYGLSSHSEVLETFAGGDAEIGIHGNNDASVLGSNVTSGCVRIDNDAITMLSKQLPLGTPVDIVS
ncbi:MAG: L,D-transpeptidase [Acidimicrobiia bacterium]